MIAQETPIPTPPPSPRPRRPNPATLLAIGSGVGLLGGVISGAMGAPAGITWASWILSYVTGGALGLRAALEELREFRVDIDLLMILAALGALAIGAPFEGAMLLFLFSLSNVLQDHAIDRSRRAIESLMSLRPDTAVVLRDGEEIEMPVEEVRVGDRFRVRPGDRLPLDGIVREGRSGVDQASLTGESAPVDREAGDEVYAGTIAGSGTLLIEVTRPASESAIARMIALVEEARSEKARTQRILDRFEQPYALGVIALTLVAIALPVLLLGEAFRPAFYRAMTLMVAASPCALIISTPAVVLSAIAAGARHGVLFKGGVHVEAIAAVRAVAFDKTGTLTAGGTRLVHIEPAPGVAPLELLRLSAAVQRRSEHHLARATLARAEEEGLDVPEVEDFQALAGRGVAGRVEGRMVRIGNARMMDEDAASHDATPLVADRPGHTPVAVVRENPDGTRTSLGRLDFADHLRPDAAAAVRRLMELGIDPVVMLTGDVTPVAEEIADAVGIERWEAELLPERKLDRIRELREECGAVAMVGDGVNDAPALALADVGIAMGGVGTDVALETADIVLIADDLRKIPWAIELGRRARRTLIANLVFAVGIIVLMIAFILTVGLPLPLAVIGHEGSTVLVSLNGLRLLAARPPA